MENKEKTIIFIISILSFTLLFGCIERDGVETGNIIKINDTSDRNITIPNNVTNLTNQTNQTTIIKCEEMTKGKEDCIIQRAYNDNNIYDCYLLKEEFFTKCINQISKNDYKHCMKLNESERDNCFVGIVDRFGDSACNMISNSTLKRDCLLRDYVEKCRAINNTYERILCNAIEKGNSSYCTKLNNVSEMNECYINYSISRNENSCSNITNLGIKIACENIIKKEMNCETIENIQLKGNCYLYYATYSKECSWCDVIIDPLYKDECYKRCAITSYSMLPCSRISTENKRDDCYFNYAIKMKDVLSCAEIKTKMFTKQCVNQVSLANKKPAECDIMENIPGLYRTDIAHCYLNVISQVKVSFNDCIMMNDAYYEDICIYNAIEEEGLATDYCAYIKDNALKTECLKR